MMQDEFEILPRGEGRSIAYHAVPGPEGSAGSRARPGLVFLGGFMSDMTGIKARRLEDFARGKGLPYLRFDYTGHGRSEGRFEDGTIGGWLGDALDVIDRLTEGPQILAGSSMGGWIALLAARARPERVRGLIGIAAAPDFTDQIEHTDLDEAQRETLQRDGRVPLPSAYGEAPYIITRALIEDGRAHRLLGAPIDIACPVRLIQGMADPDVPWETALMIARRLTGGDVHVTLIKDGDHRLSRPRDLERIGALVMELADRNDAAEAAT